MKPFNVERGLNELVNEDDVSENLFAGHISVFEADVMAAYEPKN